MSRSYRKQPTAKQSRRWRKSARGSRNGKRRFWQSQIDEAQLLLDSDDDEGRLAKLRSMNIPTQTNE